MLGLTLRCLLVIRGTPVAAENVSTRPLLAAVSKPMGYDSVEWRKVQAILGSDGPKRALGSRLRHKLLADYAGVNAELATRYGVEFPQDMPDEPAEMLAVPTSLEAEQIIATMKLVKRPPVAAATD